MEGSMVWTMIIWDNYMTPLFYLTIFSYVRKLILQ